MKCWCPTLLFVIGADTRAAVSQLEVIQSMTTMREVFLVIQDLEVGSFRFGFSTLFVSLLHFSSSFHRHDDRWSSCWSF
jgi:hypothetical protein